MLFRSITLQVGKGTWLYLPLCVCVRMPAYVGLDHAYVALTLHTCAAGQKKPIPPIQV